MFNPKLSIIIPTLNEEDYLPLLLESIKKQDFKNYEIIVADANSKDKTKKIAKNYGCRIAVGGSVARGRNQGAKISKGDLFLFIDADMFFPSSGFLTELIRKFEKRKLKIATFASCPVTQVNVVNEACSKKLRLSSSLCSAYASLASQGKTKSSSSADCFVSKRVCKSKRIDRDCHRIYNFWVKTTQKILPHASGIILIKKELHQKVGGFDEEIKIGEDHTYARQAAKFGKFGFLSMPLILTSARRFECDGRLKVYLKYVLAGVYMLLWGPVKSDIFKYRFNHYYQKSKKKQKRDF